jgi:putative PIN family toxin of toxin-antitoxin system
VHVVLDPNVLVSAVVTPGGVCARLLGRLVESPIVIVVSPRLLEEVERVLARPRFQAIPAALRAAYVDYLRRSTRVQADPAGEDTILVTADPSDDYLLRLTLADSRRLLVTGDRHLLDLSGPYPIVSPNTLLQRLP